MSGNSSQNISASGTISLEFTGTLIAFITLQQIVFLLACSSNALVIFVFIKYLKLQSVSNRVVVSLAVADFLTGVAAGIQIFYFFIMSMNTNKMACFIRYRVVASTTTASILHVTLTTFDRYIAICHPHKYKNIMTDKVSIVLISLSWVYSIVIGTLPFFGLNMWSQMTPCFYHLIFDRVVLLFDSFSVFVFMIVTFILYIFVARVALRYMKRVHPVMETNQQRNNRLKLQSNIRSARVWLIVTLAFCLCWAPFTVFPLSFGLGYEPSLTAIDIMNWLVFVGITNSFMNAFIYAWKRPDFRKVCKKIFCCKASDEEVTHVTSQEPIEAG